MAALTGVALAIAITTAARAEITYNLFDNRAFAGSINNAQNLDGSVDYSGYFGQRFKTGASGTLTALSLALVRYSESDPASTFSIYVAPDNGGQPTDYDQGWQALALNQSIGVLAATSLDFEGSIKPTLQNPANWYSNAALTPRVLAADTTYWIVVDAKTSSFPVDGFLYTGYGPITGAQNVGASGPNPQLDQAAAWSNDDQEWFQRTGASMGMALRITAVPEPSTCTMTLAGLACGGYLVRRRRTRA